MDIQLSTEVEVNTVEPRYYGHQGDMAKCPYCFNCTVAVKLNYGNLMVIYHTLGLK